MFRVKIAPLFPKKAYVLYEVKRRNNFTAVKYREIAEGTRAEMEELQGGLAIDTMIMPPFEKQADGTMACRNPADAAPFFRGYYHMM